LFGLKGMGARGTIKKAITKSDWGTAVKAGLELLEINPWDIPTLLQIAKASAGLGCYNAQLYYLDSLLRFAEEKGVKVILVNMPLRKDNLTAMMPNYYELYKSDIAKHAAKYHAQVVDLFNTDTFTDDDFIDTVHLTGHGSIKLVDKLAAAVAPNVASTVLAQQNIEKARIAGQNYTH